MGKVLRFKYSGGSHPGEFRTVYFEDVGYGTGFDLDAEAVRSFLKPRMSEVTELPCSVVNTAHLPKTIAASAIECGWRNEGRTVVRNGNTLIGYIKPVDADPSHVEPFSFGDSYGLDIQHGGRTLHVYKGTHREKDYGLYFYAPHGVKTPKNVDIAKPADLLAALQWVVNG